MSRRSSSTSSRDARDASPGQTRNGLRLLKQTLNVWQEPLSSDDDSSGGLQPQFTQSQHAQQSRSSSMSPQGRAGPSQQYARPRSVSQQRTSRSTSQHSTFTGSAGRQASPSGRAGQTSRPPQAYLGKGKKPADAQVGAPQKGPGERGRSPGPRTLPAGQTDVLSTEPLASERGRNSASAAPRTPSAHSQRSVFVGSHSAVSGHRDTSLGKVNLKLRLFMTKERLEAGIAKIAKDPLAWYCLVPECYRSKRHHDKAYPRLPQLRVHMHCHTQDMANYKCTWCPAGFPSRKEWNIHVSNPSRPLTQAFDAKPCYYIVEWPFSPCRSHIELAWHRD